MSVHKGLTLFFVTVYIAVHKLPVEMRVCKFIQSNSGTQHKKTLIIRVRTLGPPGTIFSLNFIFPLKTSSGKASVENYNTTTTIKTLPCHAMMQNKTLKTKNKNHRLMLHVMQTEYRMQIQVNTSPLCDCDPSHFYNSAFFSCRLNKISKKSNSCRLYLFCLKNKTFFA